MSHCVSGSVTRAQSCILLAAEAVESFAGDAVEAPCLVKSTWEGRAWEGWAWEGRALRLTPAAAEEASWWC